MSSQRFFIDISIDDQLKAYINENSSNNINSDLYPNSRYNSTNLKISHPNQNLAYSMNYNQIQEQKEYKNSMLKNSSILSSKNSPRLEIQSITSRGYPKH